ncbi:nucleotidyltransferase domain-containing protein [Caldanaerobius polysaccharolyticus]|uniref:nucleotidyltransferase domain-containing protein n=1 Tax=Caldanaerobius polysaccharolyticus TaxID=44256 RepID=UPI00068FA30E|nr:nucleotidyltransferase domain-containing protein [Caldanaerobius polysaccharolyticus]
MMSISAITNKRLKEILKEIENNMVSLFNNKLENIILYGSYARGDYSCDSDVDIMVLVNEGEEDLKKYDDKITDIMVDLSLKHGILVSLYVQSVQSYKKYIEILPLFRNIEKECIRIYG